MGESISLFRIWYARGAFQLIRSPHQCTKRLNYKLSEGANSRGGNAKVEYIYTIELTQKRLVYTPRIKMSKV